MVTALRDCAPSINPIEEGSPRMYGSAAEVNEGAINPTQTMHNITNQIGLIRFILILLPFIKDLRKSSKLRKLLEEEQDPVVPHFQDLTMTKTRGE